MDARSHNPALYILGACPVSGQYRVRYTFVKPRRMEHLWSPWRSHHIERFDTHNRADTGASVFTRIAGADCDEENLVVWRGEHVFVVMNLYPYNNGHLLIVPYREVADYEALHTDEQIDMARTIDRCIRWLKAALNPDGFNVGMNLGKAGGAGIPDHVHVHVVPRWHGDTNFMPTVGEVKVVPEALRETYRKLRAVIQPSSSKASSAD